MFASSSPVPRLVVGTCVLLLTAGCGGLPGDQDGGSSKTWDLAEPPTREDVGMEDDRSLVVHETDDPVEVVLRLPDGVSLEVPLVRIAFDNLGAVPARGSDPTGFDARTDRMTLAKLVPVYRSTLEQLGMRVGRVRKFEFRAGSADAGRKVQSRTSTRRYGYLRITVVAHFAASSQRGYLSVVGSWGRGRH